MTTTELTYGSLFSGYCGLDEGVQSVLGGRTSWVSEFDADASRVLAHNYPDVPNLGDMTKIKWAPDCPTCGDQLGVYRPAGAESGPGVFYWCPSCERQWDTSIRLDAPDGHLIPDPVDVLTGGSPCQDLSHAGRRKGMNDGTRSNLWVTMREAIAVLRPRLVVWENVRGAYSADADSGLEQCPRCVGDPRDGGSVLRALGRVLGDLSDLGYDAQWHGLRAADIGGAHGRFRVFVFATDRDADLTGLEGRGAGGRADQRPPREAGVGPVAHVPGQLTLLPTPVADNSRGLPSSGTDYQSLPNAVCALLPTPKSSDMNAPGFHGHGGQDLRTMVNHHLLPTPRATDGTKGGPNQRGSSGDLMLPSAVQRLLPTPVTAYTASTADEWRARRPAGNGGVRDAVGDLRIVTEELLTAQDWGPYEAAIHRCERVWGRTAPAPTETSPKGSERLSPLFVEFLMGLPAGHVTHPTIWAGMTNSRGKALTGDRLVSAARNAQLKILGNGVVPQQAAAATRLWLGQELPVIDHPTPLVPTPNPFHMGNTETPEEWRARRLDVFQRTGTRHGLPLPVFALSVVEGDPLTPDRYMPDEE